MATIRVCVVSYKFLPNYAGWLQQTLTMIQACDPEQIHFTWISPQTEGQPTQESHPSLSVRRIGSPLKRISRMARIAFGIDVVKYLLQHQKEYDTAHTLDRCASL